MSSLKASIEHLAALGEVERDPAARQTFLEFRDALTQGKVRAAEKKDGRWLVNAWVKQGILLGFRLGELVEMGGTTLSFVDKDTFPARRFATGEPSFDDRTVLNRIDLEIPRGRVVGADRVNGQTDCLL